MGPRAALVIVAFFGAVTSEAGGQGVSGAALSGIVLVDSSGAVPAASVTLTNVATGNVWRVSTSPSGAFSLDHLPVGGPFVLDVRAIGYEPVAITGIMLHVGDRFTANVTLNATQARPLAPILVRASSTRDAGAGGPTQMISGDAARRLPLIDHNFIGLLALSPLVTGSQSLAIGGQHPRFNAIQVDGGSAGDFFGVNPTPGSGTGAPSLSLETIDELRLAIAPFDVRQGGFSGALINVVTRSGTNHARMSGFASVAQSDLVGRDAAGAKAQRFSAVQLDATAAGPIVPNRLHYFAAGEFQTRHSPALSTVDINAAIAARTGQISRDVYGFDPGGIETPTLSTPSWNVFTKLSWQISARHLFDVSVNSVSGTSDVLGRSIVNRNNRDGWALSNSGAAVSSAATTLRARTTTVFGRFTNELIASYSVVGDRVDSRSHTPLFLIQTDVPKTYVAAGSVTGATDAHTDQRIAEFAENLSWSRGSHVVTAGTQDHLLHFRDNFFITSWGAWTFPDADAYERREPTRYEVALPLRPGGPLADYSVVEAAAYLQDRWATTQRLTLTAGVRADVPFFAAPFRNDSLAANILLGHVDTGRFPSGNTVFSPRVGFSYSGGRRDESVWVIRGGVGAFAGRPPYAWMTNAYSSTGRDQTTLVCGPADGVPPPVVDVAALPSRCVHSAAIGPVPSVTTFAADTRFQQAVKFDLGLEHEIGAGVVASMDFIHTATRNTLTMIDRNLVAVGTNAEGRVMYGTVSANGAAQPSRVDGAHFGAVYEMENRTGDRATALTTEIHREWDSGAFMQVGYAWSRTEDLMSLLGTSSALLFQNNPIDGSIAERRLRRSNRDTPHNVVAAAVVPLMLATTASVFFRAHSGAPYAYVVGGDANADGTTSNDLAYLPRDSGDVSLTKPGDYASLQSFIEGERCLRSQRGHVMARNSCRNPAVWSLDVRLAKSLRGFELSADVFNLPNLLHRDWGLQRATTNREGVTLMSVAGWDAASNRPEYSIALPPRNVVVPDASRWRIQLGVRGAH